uniref:hypothetical protein n=1 Tax=Klebsiella pneumoniae TaxID=573 RepID=UPI001E37BF0F|nr:hypothetical protein [Klebsiella pneumoniae]
MQGKVQFLKAIEWLLSDKKRMASDCFCSEVDAETGENKISCKEIILEAEFRNVPDDAKTWRGFKGRVFSYDPPIVEKLAIAFFTERAIHWVKMF